MRNKIESNPIPVFGECTEEGWCVDCKNTKCWHSGMISADCPKPVCDNKDLFHCDNCLFIYKLYKEEHQHVSA